MSSDWNKDWKEFSAIQGITPPAALSEKVLSKIHSELHPNAWKVFSKLALIHALVGAVTLSICPQFGIRLLGDGMGLMHIFMGLGKFGCPLACGMFFLGTSLLVATMALRPEEVRAIRNHRLLELSLLTMLSLGAFIMVDAEIVLGFAAAWVVGSILGGALVLEAGWFLRTKVLFQRTAA